MWLGAACSAALIAGIVNEAHAQGSNLPSINVEEPQRQAAKKKPAQSATAARSRSVASRSQRQRNAATAAPVASETSRAENPQGAIRGYVATRTLTGTKTNTPLNEIPQSVSVVGAEQIRDQQPQNLGQTVQYTPGVFGATFGADTRSDWAQIRGFPAEQYGVFLDGLQLFSTAYATWKLQPFGLERVEVLRGPASVLYGGTNPGGIINAVSKMPQAEPIHYLEAGVNNYGNRYIAFDIGDPINLGTGNGELYYRLVGKLRAGDTQVDHTNDDSYFIAPSVTYKPDADTSFTILAQAQKDNTKGVAFLPYVGTVTSAPFGRIPTNLFTGDTSVDKFTRDQVMVGYQFEHNITDDLTFRQNARYAHVDVDYRTALSFGYVGGNPATAQLGRFNFIAVDNADQANIDNQLEWRTQTGAIQHKVLLGVDYKNYQLNDRGVFTGGPPPLNILAPVYGVSAPYNGPYSTDHFFKQSQTGLYLQDQMKLDRWILVLSGRNDWVDINNENRVGASQARSDSKPTGRAGLIYDLGFGLSPYVSYASYYNPVPGTDVNGNIYKPETGNQSEVGVKWAPAGFDGSVNFAAFDITRQNVITADPGFPVASLQLGQVVSRGFEISTVANVTKDFKMLASFTTFDIFVKNDPNSALIGKAPTNTPSQLASLWGDYTFHTGALSGFGFGGGVRYVGKSYADNLNTQVVPDFVLGDLAVHYEWDKWRAAVNVTNITDKIYVSACQGDLSCFYGDRRRVLGTLAYKW